MLGSTGPDGAAVVPGCAGTDGGGAVPVAVAGPDVADVLGAVGPDPAEWEVHPPATRAARTHPATHEIRRCLSMTLTPPRLWRETHSRESNIAQPAGRRNPPKVRHLPTPVGGVSSGLVRQDQTGLQRHLGEARSLLVLRQVLETELVEQDSQMRLHGVEAEAQIVGHLPVGWRRGVVPVVPVGPAQRDEHRTLGCCQPRRA
jgi:hypothetical protein